MNTKKLFAALAVFAFLMSGSAAMLCESDATDLSSTYGNPTEIDLAPGYRWIYTPTFPSDLIDYITIELLETGGVAELSGDGKTVIVDIPTNAVKDATYDVVIKASMTTPVSQQKTQYVQFTVVSGLTVSGTISDVIVGTPISFTPTGTTGMTGDVTWKLKQGCVLPTWLSFSNGTVSGTPTSNGDVSFTLVATAPGGETEELNVSFTVYSQLVFTSEPTCGAVIYAISG